MDNFIFSLNATMPVFFVILVGVFLCRVKLLNESFIKVADNLNFKVTLPCLLFRDLASTNITEIFDLQYVLFCAVATIVSFSAIWILSRVFIKDRSIIGAFVQASYRSSAAVLGIAFIQNIYGDASMAPLMIIGAVPLYNIFAVILLTVEGEDRVHGTKLPIGSLLKNIFKNPIILAIAAGCAASLLHIDFPAMIDKTIANIASIATPLALLSIGAGFKGKEALCKLKPTLAAATIKLVVQAAIFLPIAAAIGIRDEKMVALLIMLAAPTTPSCYIMARQMHNDYVLSSSAIVATTVLSAVTMTGWIYLLRHFALI